MSYILNDAIYLSSQLGLPEKNIFHSDFERLVASAIYVGDVSGEGVILQDEASSSCK